MIALLSTALLLASAIKDVLASPTLIKREEPFNIAASNNQDAKLAKRQNSIVTAKYIATATEPRYVCQVNIGTQNLDLVLDTGSSDLWIFSTLLPKGNCTDYHCYDSTQSPTYKELVGSTFELYYASVTVEGIVGTDTVTIGTISVVAQAIELANEVSGWGVGDGAVGLGFIGGNQVDPDNKHTFYENAKSLLDCPLFAVYFPPQQDGAFDFGTLDQSKYTGTIQYAKVVDTKETWNFQSESFKVGNEVYDAAGTSAHIYTGSNYLEMQKTQGSMYFAAVPSSNFSDQYGSWVFPCTATLPDLGLIIGSNWATIPGPSLYRGATSDNDNQCLSYITPDPYDSAINKYGVPFLNQYYSIFDGSVPQFGFATLSLAGAVS